MCQNVGEGRFAAETESGKGREKLLVGPPPVRASSPNTARQEQNKGRQAADRECDDFTLVAGHSANRFAAENVEEAGLSVLPPQVRRPVWPSA